MQDNCKLSQLSSYKIPLIEFVSIRATEQVAIFEAHCIRVNS